MNARHCCCCWCALILKCLCWNCSAERWKWKNSTVYGESYISGHCCLSTDTLCGRQLESHLYFILQTFIYVNILFKHIPLTIQKIWSSLCIIECNNVKTLFFSLASTYVILLQFSNIFMSVLRYVAVLRSDVMSAIIEALRLSDVACGYWRLLVHLPSDSCILYRGVWGEACMLLWYTSRAEQMNQIVLSLIMFCLLVATRW